MALDVAQLRLTPDGNRVVLPGYCTVDSSHEPTAIARIGSAVTYTTWTCDCGATGRIEHDDLEALREWLNRDDEGGDVFTTFKREAAEALRSHGVTGAHEDDTAQLFVKTFGREVRWLQERGVWRICSRTARPGYWSDEDRTGTGTRMRAVAYAQADDLRRRETEQRDQGNTQAADKLARAANTVRTASHQKKALQLAQTWTEVAARGRDFDARPTLLGVANGVVDLTTGTLQPATPDLLLTRRSSTAYVPEATAPNWEKHVERVANGDPETIQLLQLAVGMTLLGAMPAKTHGFVALYGQGGNGKGTFARTMRHVLGDYAHELGARELTSRGDTHSTSLADLEGKRFVVVMELPRKPLDPDKVNGLTGGDPITARKMRQNNVTFDPSHTLWTMGNHLPQLGDVGESARRRFRPVATAPPLTEAERDPGWEDTLRAEAEGILAWAVRGCIAYQKAGWKLPEPKTMAVLRDESLEEQDEFGQWFEERAWRDEGGYVLWADLIRDLNDWRETQRALKPLPESRMPELYEWLRQRGFESGKKGGKRVRVGLRLRPSLRPSVEELAGDAS
jgi:putative DNA primase/helicase